jgi:transcriptional regulator with XRE-family HTH domain
MLHGITQKEMAGNLGIDPSTLARWEKKKREGLRGALAGL